MPTYDYTCLACSHRFDTVQSMGDEPLTSCPECGGRLRRIFGTVGVAFKGSGFYRTDSRPRRESGAAKPSTKTEAKTEAKTETKSETKSETKTPPPSKTGSTA